MWTPEEIDVARDFVADGGRLLLISDPDLFGDYAPIVNILGEPFGVVFNEDYLYDTERNDRNFINFFADDFGGEAAELEGSLVAFYGARSLSGDVQPQVRTVDTTLSSVRTGLTDFTVVGVAGLAENGTAGRVLAMSDIDVLAEPYVERHDNRRLVRFVADFLADSLREETIIDFPNYLSREVALVYGSQGAVDAALLIKTAQLQQRLQQTGRTLGLSRTAVITQTETLTETGMLTSLQMLTDDAAVTGAAELTSAEALTEIGALTGSEMVTGAGVDGNNGINSTLPLAASAQDERDVLYLASYEVADAETTLLADLGIELRRVVTTPTPTPTAAPTATPLPTLPAPPARSTLPPPSDITGTETLTDDVPLTGTEPLTGVEPLTDVEPLTQTEPVTDIEPLTGAEPLTEVQPLTEVIPLTETEPLTEVIPPTGTPPLTLPNPLTDVVPLTTTGSFLDLLFRSQTLTETVADPLTDTDVLTETVAATEVRGVTETGALTDGEALTSGASLTGPAGLTATATLTPTPVPTPEPIVTTYLQRDDGLRLLASETVLITQRQNPSGNRTVAVLGESSAALRAGLDRLLESNFGDCFTTDDTALCPFEPVREEEAAPGVSRTRDDGSAPSSGIAMPDPDAEPDAEPSDPDADPTTVPAAPGGEPDGDATLLIIDDNDEAEEGEISEADTYISLLTQAGYTPDLETTAAGLPDVADLQRYDVIIWSAAGYAEGGPTVDDLTPIFEYLNEGGRLWISSRTPFFGESLEPASALVDAVALDGIPEVTRGFPEEPIALEGDLAPVMPLVQDEANDSLIVLERGPESEDSEAPLLFVFTDANEAEPTGARLAVLGMSIDWLPAEYGSLLVENMTAWMLSE